MFTNLSTGVTAPQKVSGPREKYFMVFGDFGASGQVQIQIQAGDGSWQAFSDLTFDQNAIKWVRLPANRSWRIEAINCTSVDVELL